MTKDEIKKALECCTNTDSCVECPYHIAECNNRLCEDALDLIKEQESECEYRKKQYDNQLAENTQLHIEYDKAFQRLEAQQQEVERLKAENEQLEEDIDMMIKEQKYDHQFDIAQAQIDILNKAKEKLDSAPNGWAYTGYIDDLIEELQK